MDDPKTQAILDALADLFLTGQSSGGSSSSAGGAGTKSFPEIEKGVGRGPGVQGVGGGGHGKEDPLAGPGPIPMRLGPKVGSSVLEGVGGKAKLEERAMRASERAEGWRVEAVVLGSLPGLAGAWISQYAEHVARECGEVLLVRLGRERVEIERIRSGEGEVENQVRETRGALAGGAVELLDALLDEANGKVGAVLVQVGSLEEAMEVGLRRCTVLCGGYETAVVEARKLAERWMEKGGQMQVMFMGVDQEQAKAAFQRLKERLNGSGVSLAGWRKQISPVCGWVEGEFVLTGPMRRELVAYLRAIEQVSGAGVEEKKTEAARPAMVGVGQKEKERVQEAVREAKAARETEVGLEGEGSVGRVGGMGMRRGREWEYWLGQAVVPGGLVLEARCPAERGALLVLDEAGRVHVVVQERGGSAGEAVLRLLRVVRWVGEHRQLLAMTQRQCRFDERAEPAMHVVTEDVRQAMVLAGAVGPWVRVHYVQARPSQEAETAWECVLVS